MKKLISNYKEFKKNLVILSKTKDRKKLLIHSCCAPCSTHVLKILYKIFEITILFYNPNIYPEDEYNKRYEELVELIKKMNLKIEVIKIKYNHDEFLNAILGKESLGEKSIRCYECYKKRISFTAHYAKKNNYDYYTTTLSISPYKNSHWINEIGYLFEDDNTHYLYSDYKKEDGYKNSIILSKQYGLYRQDYCGCEFSKKEHIEKLALSKNKNQ